MRILLIGDMVGKPGERIVTRFARGQAFGRYVNEKLGAHHTTTVVPLCGHNARCMFTADPVLKLVFPTPSS